MMGDDNRVKEVLLRWLSSQSNLRDTPTPKKQVRDGAMRYSWSELVNGEVDSVWLAKTWVTHTFQEAINPPVFCKSYENLYEKFEGDWGAQPNVTYWHPNAWDRIKVMENVMALGIDVSDYFGEMQIKMSGVVKDWVMMQTKEDQLVFEARLSDTHYLKMVPDSLYRSCKAYAIERGKLFPGLCSLISEDSNVTYVQFK